MTKKVFNLNNLVPKPQKIRRILLFVLSLVCYGGYRLAPLVIIPGSPIEQNLLAFACATYLFAAIVANFALLASILFQLCSELEGKIEGKTGT